jgi:hypothetical protein
MEWHGSAQKGTPMSNRAQSDTAQFNWRMREPIRAALEAAAKKRGISINQEITRRIEASFTEERTEERRINEAFGNAEIFGLLKVVASAFVEGGRMGAHLVSAKNYVENPFAYDHAVKAANKIFELFRPNGEIVPPKKTDLPGPWGGVIDNLNSEIGERAADYLLEDIRTAAGIETSYYAIDGTGKRTPRKPRPIGARLSAGLSDNLARRLRKRKGGDK